MRPSNPYSTTDGARYAWDGPRSGDGPTATAPPHQSEATALGPYASMGLPPHSSPYASPYTTPAPAAYAHPVAMPQPAPTYIVSGSQSGSGRRSGGGTAATLVIGVLALVMAVVAGVVGFSAAQGYSPTDGEMNAYQSIANQEGAIRGREAGFDQGRAQGIQENQNIALLQGKIAQARAYNNAFNLGRKQNLHAWRGNRSTSSTANRGTGYYGYAPARSTAARSYNPTPIRRSAPAATSTPVNSPQVRSAVAEAQRIANATGQVVDVTVY